MYSNFAINEEVVDKASPVLFLTEKQIKDYGTLNKIKKMFNIAQDDRIYKIANIKDAQKVLDWFKCGFDFNSWKSQKSVSQDSIAKHHVEDVDWYPVEFQLTRFSF